MPESKTVSDERLDKFIETCQTMGDAGEDDQGNPKRHQWWDELASVLTELQSLRRSSSRGEVKARTLEWKHSVIGDGTALRQNSWRAGNYQIVESPSGNYDLRGHRYAICGTLNEAKAAAQADYERRILSTVEQEQAEPVKRERHGETGYGYETQSPSPPEIDDGMIERFGVAFWGAYWLGTAEDKSQVRAALTAALSPEVGK